MKTFIAQQMEIAECELQAEGLPVTQEGAEALAKRRWKGTPAQRRQRKLEGCYGKRRAK